MSDSDFYASQAELYDLAFSWDVDEEAAWLLRRFGPGTQSVLEPFCGNGRLFPSFARRGVETAGVDLSAQMLAKAEDRMVVAGFAPPLLKRDDVRSFDFGRQFDGAFVPVNSLGYMHSADDLVRHLHCVARHLRPGGRYLVQLGLRDLADFKPLAVDTTSQWDVETPRGKLRTTWKSGDFNPASRIETQISRFEWLTGAHAGHLVEFEHAIRVWDWTSWSAALAASPFTEVAAWDGDKAARPALPVGPEMQGKLLAWHELATG
jgi:SAM-dependent methyltransferase